MKLRHLYTPEEWDIRTKEINRLRHERFLEANPNYFIDYRKTPKELKRIVLKDWRAAGITFGEMTPSFYYDVIYLPALKCMSCDKDFNKINRNDWKCNDHLHERDKPCNVRGVICNECNIHDNWKKRLTPNSIYNQYL